MTDNKDTVQWAMACARYPQPGHKSHVWMKRDEPTAWEAAWAADKHSARYSNLWHGREAPHQVLTRTIPAWVQVNPGPLHDPDVQPALFDQVNL